MPTSTLLKPLLNFLLLATLVTASRFSFSIQEISVERTRDISEDDLILVIASTAGPSTTNKTYPLRSVEGGTTIKWDNLTSEIDVPATATNLSIAIGLLNNADDDEEKAINTSISFAKSIITIAASVPGPQASAAKLLDIVFGFVGANLFNCDGPVVVGNAVYASEILNGMDKGKKSCETRNYAYETPKETCGVRGSNYTVTHCLERLDDKASSAGVKGVPGWALSFVGLATTLIWGSYGLLL